MFAKLKSMLTEEKPAAGNSGGARETLFFANNAPSWEELQAMVEKQQKELGWVPQDPETGPANIMASKRTFGKDDNPSIILYRDHAHWCLYCQKVQFQLEEKQIPYRIEKINMRCYGDKPPEFLAKVPSGLLPVVEIDGKIITESVVIMGLLEQMYPENPLLPEEGCQERARAMSLMRLERRIFGDWLQWLCSGWGNDGNKAAFENTMAVVEKELGETSSPYFLDDFSLIDVVFAPVMERIAASIAYYKGYIVRGQGKYPNLERWFAALETRPAYLAFKSDYYTHAQDLPPQLGGCVSIPEAAPVAAAIDGDDGKSWHLPLPPLNASSLEPYAPGEDPKLDCLKAAAKLTSNHENVAKFALRGVGKPGPRPVSAPLSDPTAIPGMDHFAEVDAALRHVAHAMLSGGGENCAAIETASDVTQDGDSEWVNGAPVVPSLQYLRDRVGVPRDLPLPSARQLRAHLNWAIDAVSKSA